LVAPFFTGSTRYFFSAVKYVLIFLVGCSWAKPGSITETNRQAVSNLYIMVQFANEVLPGYARYGK